MLMDGKRKDVARAFVRYRYKRELVREAKTNLDNEIFGLKDGTSEEVINNANKNGKLLQTLKPMIADVTIIDQAKRYYVPERIMKHHQKEIYIHDMNYFGIPMHNCQLVNWEDCLENGMVIGNAPIEKPNTITVAVNLLSQIAAHVSSNCYGGITFINLTKGLCQYGRGSLNTWRKKAQDFEVPNAEDFAWKMLEREISKSIKGLEYEILTLTNSRGEIPFTTFELDCIDLDASEEDQKIQYLILTNMLKVRIDGLTGGVTPVFPKLCFELKAGNNLNPEDKYYDIFKLAVKCSSLRLYPDYLMHDKLVEVTGGYKAPMSCRSFIPELHDNNGNRIVGGGFNLGVCSVNLVRLAIMAEHSEEKFYELLKEYLDMCRDALMIRRDMMKTVKAKQAPILYQYGAIARLNPEDDKLMDFGKKHLPDKFFLEDSVNKSLRNTILREMVSNILMHREFSSSYTAKFVIEKDRMYVENASRATGEGFITVENLEPNPENPIIAAFFRNIGYADQLGSGVHNLFKYSKYYSGKEPEFVEGDVFKIIIPLDDKYSFDFKLLNDDVQSADKVPIKCR